MGHVDSGKTSLVRALSTQLSTAALDKSPQSQARGITLDLGFSAFSVPPPPAVRAAGFDALQFTLVDCPGHASLIRTIIGAAQIIEMMLLVVDVTKGIQTQTAECLVVGEITTDTMIVVLNKVDLLPAGPERAARIAAVTAKLRKALASTPFAAAPFVAVSALTAAAAAADATTAAVPGGSASVSALVDAMAAAVRVPQRDASGPFLFAVDHCFAIRGQGTVLTGTALTGCVAVNDVVALPALGLERKVKSMQMFHAPVTSIRQGDRAGICVTNLDAALVERGLVASPGTVPTLQGAIALVRKIRFFKGACASQTKFHVTVGHTTVMASVVFFGAAELAAARSHPATPLQPPAAAAAPLLPPPSPMPAAPSARHVPRIPYNWAAEFEWQPELLMGGGGKAAGGGGGGGVTPPTPSPIVYEWQWAALLFDAPIVCPHDALLIGSHLDADLTATSCRLAFHGRLAAPLPSNVLHELRRCNLFKRKERRGVVDRLDDKGGGGGGEAGAAAATTTVIVRSLFKKETDMSLVAGLAVSTAPSGRAGVIDCAFGKSGKVKATFEGGGVGGSRGVAPGDAVLLRYRKWQFEPRSGAAAGAGSGGGARRANKFVQ